MRGSLFPFALASALFLAPPAFCQKPADLDKVVPADALVHFTVDGIEPLKNALVGFLNSVMPGAGGMMVEGTVMQVLSQPGMDQVDTAKPLSFTFLPGDKGIVAVPVKDAAAFEKGLQDSGAGASLKLIPGEGTSLLAFGGDVNVDELKKKGAAKPPSLPGTIRAFINVKGLFAAYREQIDSWVAMMGAVAAQSGGAAPNLGELIKGFATDVTRIDVGLGISGLGLEATTSFGLAPEAKGMLSAIAKTQPSTAANKYLAAIPANAVVGMTGKLSPELSAGYLAMLESLIPSMSPAAKSQLREFFEQATALSAGDFAGGITGGADGESFSTVTAAGCSDKEKMRALMKRVSTKDSELVKSLGSTLPGATFSVDYKPAAGVIDGLEVDHLVYHIEAGPDANPQTKTTVEQMKKMMFGEPFQFAYPAGFIVLASGKGAGDALKAALASLKSGAAPGVSPAAAALPSGTSFAVSVNLIGYLKVLSATLPPEIAGMLAGLKGAPAGKDYVTISMVPSTGAAQLRLIVPAGAVRSIVMAFQGVGGAPK